MERYKPLFESFYKLSDSEISDILHEIRQNEEVAYSFFKKIFKYTNEWKIIPFTSEELSFYKKIHINKLQLPKLIYRSEKINNKDFEKQYNSWTTRKSGTNYFQRGANKEVTKKLLTNKDFYIDLTFLHSFINKISVLEDIDINLKLKNLFEDNQLYDENEILMFNKI